MRTEDTDFHDRLLTKLRQEPGFSGSKLEARIKKDEDALQDIISEEADVIFSLEWSPDDFGHAGNHNVVHWRNYYWFESSDIDEEGPFDTFREVLDLEYFHVETCNPEILANHDVPFKIAKGIALNILGQNGDPVVINGDTSRKGRRGLVRVK